MVSVRVVVAEVITTRGKVLQWRDANRQTQRGLLGRYRGVNSAPREHHWNVTGRRAPTTEVAAAGAVPPCAPAATGCSPVQVGGGGPGKLGTAQAVPGEWVVVLVETVLRAEAAGVEANALGQCGVARSRQARPRSAYRCAARSGRASSAWPQSRRRCCGWTAGRRRVSRATRRWWWRSPGQTRRRRPTSRLRWHVLQLPAAASRNVLPPAR